MGKIHPDVKKIIKENYPNINSLLKKVNKLCDEINNPNLSEKEKRKSITNFLN